MDFDRALAFAVFALAAAATPGPSNALLAAVGAQAGLRRGLPTLIGVSAGMASLLFVVAFGMGDMLARSPGLVLALRFGGAALLLHLAWRIASAPADAVQGTSPRGAGFIGAAALQWVNPKAWMVGAGAASTYLAATASPFAQAVHFAAVFVAVALPSGFAWLAAGAAMGRLLGTPRRRRAFNVAMGALLALSVVATLR